MSNEKDIIDTSLTYRLSERVLLKEDDDQLLAFDPETLAVHQLNESLARIANTLDGKMSCEELVAMLRDTYGLSVADAAKEVYRALEILTEHNLLETN